MFRVGLIGCGSIAKNAHLPAYAQIAEKNGPVIVEAYCDCREDALDGLPGRHYTSVDEMLEKEKGRLDIIDICTPTYLHAQIAVKALNAGYHVLSEKPMAYSVEEAQQMVAAAKCSGRTLMIAYCNRFYNAAQYIREAIRSGELGAVRSAQFLRNGGPPPTGSGMWFRDGNRSGGALLDLHIHDVDLIRWMFGMPKAVSTVAASYVTDNGYDMLSANFMYENDVFVHASCDWCATHDKFNTRVIRVNFEKGYIHVDRTPGRQVFTKVTTDGEVTDMTDALEFNAYYNEIMYFVDCLAKGTPVTECLPEESLDSVRIVMAQKRSAQLGGEKVFL